MSNKGWNSTAGDGPSVSSTDRQSGRCTPLDGADAFVRPVDDAKPGGPMDDTYGTRGDLYEVRGNLSDS